MSDCNLTPVPTESGSKFNWCNTHEQPYAVCIQEEK